MTRPGDSKYVLENCQEKNLDEVLNPFKTDLKNLKALAKIKSAQTTENQPYEEQFDSTGMFHYVKEQEFKNCLLTLQSRSHFAKHVIVCIFAEPNSPLIGLRNFVLPLRASNYHYEELKNIILIGNQEFLLKEWKSICNFPKIHIFPVSFRTTFSQRIHNF